MWQPTTRSVSPSTTSLRMRAYRAGKRHLQRTEQRLVDVDLGQPLAGCRFGQTDHADFGLGENRGRHIAVIDRGGSSAEHRVGEWPSRIATAAGTGGAEGGFGSAD